MEEGEGVKHGKNNETNFCNCKQGKPSTNFMYNFSPQETREGSLCSNSQPPHEPDLNLRLSLGSVDSASFKENHLTRSSSIDGVLTLRTDADEVGKSFLSLARSSSLPTEAEKELRLISVRELQTMRRIEARNRLVGRQRSFEEGKEKEKFMAPEAMPALPPQVTGWASPTLPPPAERSPALYQAIVKIKPQGHLAETKHGMYVPLMSPATSSLHGMEGSAAPDQPGSFKSSSDPWNAEHMEPSQTSSNALLLKSAAKTKLVNPYKRARITGGNFQDNSIDVMRQMPSVTTTGDGPNGRRIEGFLYTYTRGHVSIVCVCHGSFLSPAEFVKHAGGKDVSDPMKHITVYSSFSA